MLFPGGLLFQGQDGLAAQGFHVIEVVAGQDLSGLFPVSIDDTHRLLIDMERVDNKGWRGDIAAIPVGYPFLYTNVLGVMNADIFGT